MWIILEIMTCPYLFHCEYHKETEEMLFQYRKLRLNSAKKFAQDIDE